MDRKEIRKQRLDLLLKRDKIENLLQHNKDKEIKKKLEKELEVIGKELENLVKPRKKVTKVEEFWNREGWKFNKFDYIKLKLMHLSDKEITERIGITKKQIDSSKTKWKLPKIKNETWGLYEITDFEEVLEILEICIDKGYDANSLLEDRRKDDELWK